MGWAAGWSSPAARDLVDVNFGCPIDHFTRKGLGASIGRQPGRIRRIVEAMKRGVPARPGHGQDPAGLERRRPQLSRPGPGGRRRRRRRDHRPRPHPERPLPAGRRLGRDRRGGGGGADAGHRQRRSAVPARDRGGSRAVGLRGGDVGPRRADQAVAVPRGRRGYRISTATLAWPSTVATWHWPSSTGATTTTAATRAREFLRWHVGFWCRYARRRRRLLAVDAAPGGAAGPALAARGAAGAIGRSGARLRQRSAAGRRADSCRRRAGTRAAERVEMAVEG